MSFDYLNDLFGKFRKNKTTKFSPLEKNAKRILENVYNKKISYNQFYEEFSKIINEFVELTDNTIDEDTPLWINSFGYSIFLKWQQWHILRISHQKYPEKFNTPELEAQYREIESHRYDEWLMSKIKYCLDELKK